MKNLTKIFMAVVAAMFAFSCVTDTTDDLGVQLGNEGQTTISLSLEDGRTHIQGKVGDEYPLYWSADDKIAVNGETSAPLAESDHGQKTATFTVEGTPGYPRTIVYPAPADGVTASAEGYYPVTFLATQNYTPGTFAEGAAPMYSYQATNADAAVLQHLAGVLRIAPKGEGVTLTSMELSAEEGKIAGNFDLAADGTLTAQSSTISTVTVNFGENGLALGAEATPIYVAIPKGEYSMIAVTLYTANDSMTIRFDTKGDKLIVPGVVREFPEFTYEANAGADKIFEIYDEASLRRFAAIASRFYPYTTAKVVATIDMTGKEWSPIEGFGEYTFDGGKSEGFEIKGLKAPLFGSTAASTIQNVKLTDVNINHTDASSTYIGTVACKITNSNAVVKHCHVQGSMVVEVKDGKAFYVGGVICESESTKQFAYLTNEVNITIKGNYTDTFTCLGCVYSHGGALRNVTNLGNLEFAGSSTGEVRLGGIERLAGSVTDGVNGTADPALKDSKGKICISGTCGSVRIGGISPNIHNTTLDGCKNYGKVYLASTATTAQVFMGGITGIQQSATATFINCENHGELALEQSTSATDKKINIGGLMGQPMSHNYYIHGFINTGAINVNPKVSGTINIAGVVANHNGVTFTSNNNTVIKNTGKITYSGKANGDVSIGGLFANMADGKVAPTNVNYENYGDIEVTGTGSAFYIGGIQVSARKIQNARCYCNIKAVGCEYVGMIMSKAYNAGSKATNCHIGGSIWISGEEATPITFDNYPSYVYKAGTATITEIEPEKCGWLESKDAGAIFKVTPDKLIANADDLIAFAAAVKANTSLAENYAITANIDMAGKEWSQIEGYKGTLDGGNHEIKGLTAPLFGTTKASIQNLKLTDVNINNTADKKVGLEWVDGNYTKFYLGALACKIDNENSIVYNCSATGTITDNLSTHYVHIGGIVGTSTSTKIFAKLTSDVDIVAKGSYTKTVELCGCVYSHKGEIWNSQNLGTVEYAGEKCSDLRMGGIASNCVAMKNCVNGSATAEDAGTVVISGTCSSVRMGGIIGNIPNGLVVTKCINYGKVYLSDTASTAQVFMGGLAGIKQNATVTFDACENRGEVAADQSTSSKAIRLGGLLGQAMSTGEITIKNGFLNTGLINCNPKSEEEGVYVGGFIANLAITYSTDSTGLVKNEGEVRYAGNATTIAYVGGLFGSQSKALPSAEAGEIRYENVGKVNVTGTASDSYIGGISGNAVDVINNARCYCEIIAYISNPHVGMITGTQKGVENEDGEAKESIKAVNCYAGGSIDKGVKKNSIDPITNEEVYTWVSDQKDLSAENYFQYIYSIPIEKTVAEADGCQYYKPATETPAE